MRGRGFLCVHLEYHFLAYSLVTAASILQPPSMLYMHGDVLAEVPLFAFACYLFYLFILKFIVLLWMLNWAIFFTISFIVQHVKDKGLWADDLLWIAVVFQIF